MTPYHGTPIGGSRQDVARFLKSRHALVPFARQDDLGIVADVCQSFIFDNSAFTYWKQGGEMDIERYVRWCEEWQYHPGFDWALIPDVIDGTENDNDALVRDWPTRLRSKGVPVYHLHESLERLARLLAEWPAVALGSSGEFSYPNSASWWERMEAVMEVACDPEGRPKARLHGLRMLNPAVFTKIPLKSADSTNAGMNCGSLKRFGQYVPPTAAQRAAVIADRIESHNSPACWTNRIFSPSPKTPDLYADQLGS